MVEAQLPAGRVVDLLWRFGRRQYVNDFVIIITRLPPRSQPSKKGSNNMRTLPCPERGFTLVEIMIVVAIIGMLAGIAIPNYVQAREEARRNTCVNNLMQIDGAVARWALEQKKDAGDPVTYEDISAYLARTVACPSGGRSFADSYTLTTVDAKPVCQRKPAAHKITE